MTDNVSSPPDTFKQRPQTAENVSSTPDTHMADNVGSTPDTFKQRRQRRLSGRQRLFYAWHAQTKTLKPQTTSALRQTLKRQAKPVLCERHSKEKFKRRTTSFLRQTLWNRDSQPAYNVSSTWETLKQRRTNGGQRQFHVRRSSTIRTTSLLLSRLASLTKYIIPWPHSMAGWLCRACGGCRPTAYSAWSKRSIHVAKCVQRIINSPS